MNLVKRLYFRQIALIVAFSVFIIGSIPAKSMAYVVGSQEMQARSTRAEDINSIQRVLESKLVSERLEQSGLSLSEIKPRLDRLTDEELHSFAAQLDSLNPGGDGLGVIIALLIIVILVLIILKLADRKIVIR